MELECSNRLFESNGVANTKSPCGQALNVLRLPDELLVRIFEFVADCAPTTETQEKYCWPHRERESGNPFIGVVGLTCRRFRDTSAHLLLNRVSVYLTPASLQRLEAISQHPTIRRGIRSVQVNLQYYDSVIANDITAFAEEASQPLFQTLGAREHPNIARNRNESAGMVQGCQMYWALLCLSMGWPGDPDEDDSAYRDLAQIAHIYYRESWLEQKSILRNGYVDAVASAVARMPLARRLELCTKTTFDLGEMDEQTHIQPPFVRASRDRLFQDLACIIRPFFPLIALPSTWTIRRHRNWSGLPPYELPLALLSAFSKAGYRPRTLSLDLPISDDMSHWHLSEEQLEDISQLGQHINAFCFDGSEFLSTEDPASPYLAEESDDSDLLKPLGTFLRTLLRIDRLKTLEVDLQSTDGMYSSMKCSLGDIVTIKPLPYVQSLTLRGIHFHLSDLEVLLSSQQGSVRIVLEDVGLLTGTWPEALDMLHGKGVEGSYCAVVTGGGYPLFDETLQEIFDGCCYGNNRATECILGLRDNPLRRADGSSIIDITNLEDNSEDDGW